jgi:hypothetical protein
MGLARYLCQSAYQLSLVYRGSVRAYTSCIKSGVEARRSDCHAPQFLALTGKPGIGRRNVPQFFKNISPLLSIFG